MDSSEGIRGSGVVARGIVRVDDDADSDLRVKVVLVEETLGLITDVAEVGTWPVEAVNIVRVEAGRFDFTVAGDTVSFFPDEPEEFAQLGIVSVASPKRPRFRRRAHKAVPRAGDSPLAKNRKRRKEKQSPDPPSQADTSRPIVKPAAATAEGRFKRRGSPPVSTRVAQQALVVGRRTAARLKIWFLWTRSKVGVMGRLTAARLKIWFLWTRWKIRLGWLWILDHLRQTDVYLLDRIPVVTDEMRLEPGHEHTYEVRVGGVGLTRYVCTSCRKLRLTPPSELDDDEGPGDDKPEGEAPS